MADQHSTPARASANKVRLTTKYIESLKPPPKGERLMVSDLDEPGLAIRVFDSGHKSFVVTKRIRNGPPKRVTLKPSFPTLGLAAAREMAREVKVMLSNGIDPLARQRAEDAKREQAKAEARDTSFVTVAEQYIVRKVIGSNPDKPLLRTSNEMAQSIRRDLLQQPWAKKPVAQVTKQDIVGMIAGMVKTKPGQWSQVAFRSFNYARQILKWALKRDEYRLTANVCDRIDIKEEIGADQPTARDRILSDRELRIFWAATGRLAYPGGPMLRLLLLSACRLREIAHLEHVEISTVERSDYAGPVITIAAERVKGRNGKVGKHAVPVTTAMADVLGTVPKFMTPGRFVFSCSGGRSPMGAFDILKTKVDVAILAALREELGLPDGAEVPAEHLLPRWTFHDLRRTGRSIMSRLGVNQDVAEKVLAHKVSGIRGVYDHHDFLAEKAEALRALSDEIGRITGNNVVPLRRASA